MTSAIDRRWMSEALALARLGEGHTRPNPKVGCVIVRDGVRVGAGYHRRAGGRHAEVVALDEAGAQARGATLYVNLEPCCHHGRTPPCVDAILKAGVTRVVASVRDPNPRVDGRGFDKLRAAGVDVTVDVLRESGERLNAPFMHWQRTKRPFVTLKAAVSTDGAIAGQDGISKWITGDAARLYAHRLRWTHDAVMVGAETVRADDPRLTARCGPDFRVPLRVVVTSSFQLDPAARVFDGEEAEGRERTRVYTTMEGLAGSGRFQAPDVDVIGLPAHDGRLSPRDLLDHLGADGVQSVLLEGGGNLQAAFVNAGLVDDVALFVSPKLLGHEGATPWLPIPAIDDPAHAARIEVSERIPLGDDVCVVGRLHLGERTCSPD